MNSVPRPQQMSLLGASTVSLHALLDHTHLLLLPPDHLCWGQPPWPGLSHPRRRPKPCSLVSGMLEGGSHLALQICCSQGQPRLGRLSTLGPGPGLPLPAGGGAALPSPVWISGLVCCHSEGQEPCPALPCCPLSGVSSDVGPHCASRVDCTSLPSQGLFRCGPCLFPFMYVCIPGPSSSA